MKVRTSIVTLALVLLVLPASAQRTAPAAARPVAYLTAQQLRELEAHIEQARQQWEIPGLAVAIVQRDSVMLARGYGVKELGKPDKVDEHTLFAIGSSGKSMTAALVAMLVDEGKMKLDDPVWTYLPKFKVADPYVSREATMRDLLSHRTGLANTTAVWYGAPLTRAQVIDKLRFLPQAAGFRSRFLYNNLMIMVAGEAAAAAAGTTWEELVRSRLFQPLGMTSSLSNPEEITPRSNVATPHTPAAGKLAPIPHRNTRNIGPAGSQYSSARDMAQYLRFHLGNGMYNGKRVVSEELINQMRAVVTSNGTPVLLTDSTTTGLGYGLGWFTEYFRGHRMMRHGGSIDGMLTEMMYLPEAQVAVVVLSNRSPHSMHTALTHHIFDVALGLPQRDWNGQSFARSRGPQGAQGARPVANTDPQQPQRPQNAPPSLPLERYAGTYTDSLNGNITVVHVDGGLTFKFHPGFEGRAEPWQYNTFRVDWQGGGVLAGSGALATFNLDQTGRPVELVVGSLGRFRASGGGRTP